jgi:excinuclease ABC subunit B
MVMAAFLLRAQRSRSLALAFTATPLRPRGLSRNFHSPSRGHDLRHRHVNCGGWPFSLKSRVLSTVQSSIVEETYEDEGTTQEEEEEEEEEEETQMKLTSPTALQEEYQSSLKNNDCMEVTAPFEPTGDQPEAIQQLLLQLEQYKDRFSILQGITGTGKTLVMSHLIAKTGKPTLVLCHNKTLAAQLARELRAFLGNHAVELFVSYYNHYVPESFNEATSTYTAKKSSINHEIDALRHRATRALLMSPKGNVVVVASVSCIYGLGLPKDYLDASTTVAVADVMSSPQDLTNQLDAMLYQNETQSPDGTDHDSDTFGRGKYQVQAVGTTRYKVSVWPPHESFPMILEVGRRSPDNDDNQQWQIESIYQGHASGHEPIISTTIFPAKHHVMSEDRLEQACLDIEDECRHRVKELSAEGKFDESNRLQQRVTNDLMMLRETGFCSGGENYSRHFAGREPGQPPDTLLDYMSLNGQRDWLLMVDESHATIPQLKAMYHGDKARKERLVKHGYRLPSALDNRPLTQTEFWDRIQQAVFVSATPSRHELEMAERDPVSMVIRPTYVCDPVIEVRPSEGQLEDLVQEVGSRARRKERTIAVSLTKRDAEDLADYLMEQGIPSAYIHSGLTTHERADALKSLQEGRIQCLVGVNLLREGIDLPQVSLVAILNADSEVSSYLFTLRSHSIICF